jgi:integrase
MDKYVRNQNSIVGKELESRTLNDHYGVERRLELVTKRIRESREITARNKELIFRFADNCSLRSLSKLRVLFYLNRFWNIARLTEKDFDKMDREGIEDLVRKIQMKGFKPRTVSDHLTAIKTFWKWLEGNEDIYPENVRWIKPWRSNKTRKLPEQLLTKEDVEKLVNAAVNPRDKALISVLYESGCRIGEILSLKIRNVEFDNNGAVLIVNGKTGQRRVRLIHSVPRLMAWLEHHPKNNSPDTSLWVCLGSRNNSERLVHQSVASMLRKTTKRAGLTKGCNPHLFRHSRATFLAKHLTEAQMKEYFGWTQASDMAAIYVHLSGRDVDNALLKLAGKNISEAEKESEMDRRATTCSICKHENAPEMRRCSNCARPLDLKTALEDDKREHELLNMLTPEILEEMIQKRVQQLLTSNPQPNLK